jgi:RimJ/RimL family protein N-acetyltransferase
MKSTTIESNSYIMRPFKISDAELWQIWDTDPEVQSFMPEPFNEVQNIEEQYKYIEECGADEEGFYWSIETKSGATIGTIALTELNSYHQVADLGIVIGDKNYWGKGVATEVIRALVNYAFAHLNIRKISAEVEDGNVGMIKAFEKIGFKQDGVFESARVKNNQRISVYHFGIINIT